MKVIIAGSRSIVAYIDVARAIEESVFECSEITEVVSGAAHGVDQLGELWAIRHGIKVTRFPADWDRYGRYAGFQRNERMAKYADALIAVWDGESRGTAHMIDTMKRLGKLVDVITVEQM